MTHSRLRSILAVLSLISPPLCAQSSYPEAEPNSTKAEASAAGIYTLNAGDSLTGTSTGASGTVGSTAVGTADMFRIRTGALPLGIYAHRLTLTTSGTAGHSGSIRGLTQSAGGIINTATDAAFQLSATTTTPPRMNQWYGFGKQEETYYRVSGASVTIQPYVATLTTTPVSPTPIPGVFSENLITVSSVGQGHSTNTEIYLFDANLDPVPLGHNDDPLTTLQGPSSVSLFLSAGTYYVAISTFNTSNNVSDLDPTEERDDAPVLDFPNSLASSQSTVGLDLTFSVSDGLSTVVVPAAKNSPFEIWWGSFSVVGIGTFFCPGDGTGTGCPCGNAGLAANGCANSTFSDGSHLYDLGVPSVSLDSLSLNATNMPGPGLYFQGTSTFASGAGIVFGDGLLCAGGTITRLGVVFPTLGDATYPGGLTPNPIHIAGSTSGGDVRHYQVWYRDAASFCTSATFNLTQGLTIAWVP